MDVTKEILSDITIWMKYAKYLPELNRRETWKEIVDRNKNMHLKKFPNLSKEIEEAYRYVYERKVLPSMRSMQFAGKPLELNNARGFNCSYLPINDHRAFSEVMFLLLSGCGVGYSVQSHHIEELPEIRKPLKKKRYLIGDSIEGWADSIRMLFKAYFGYTNSMPAFDFGDIRPKGAQLITAGGKAPGPEPLKIALIHVQSILDRKQDGEKLSSLECHDIICHLADAVLSGGIRRAALISLFDLDDEEMLTCKFGEWWELNPQRGRANNTAVLLRSKIDKDTFINLWKKIEASRSGEPGFIFTDDKDAGTNPCAEINLKPNQFCNLCEINISDVESQEDLNNRARVASFIGTLQASYTNFHYLRDVWKKQTEKEALLGIGQTGIASGTYKKLNLKEAANIACEENEKISKIIGINKAARVTTVKPSGTTSLVLGTSSGIHAWHDDYYLRSIRVGKNEAIYTYLLINHPELLEDDVFKPTTQAVIRVPQKSPEGSITRGKETALDLLERIKTYNREWIKPGHRKGANMHNVSATVNIKENEWSEVGEWLWENKEYFTALSFLPEDLGTYIQAPYSTIKKEDFDSLVGSLHNIDLSQVIEIGDGTNLMDNQACVGGSSCEIV
jgi:ribonucleoside-triphosphate reductase (thioredoxin)